MTLKGSGIVNQMANKFPLVDLDLTSAMRETLINDVMSYKLDATFISTIIKQ